MDMIQPFSSATPGIINEKLSVAVLIRCSGLQKLVLFIGSSDSASCRRRRPFIIVISKEIFEAFDGFVRTKHSAPFGWKPGTFDISPVSVGLFIFKKS